MDSDNRFIGLSVSICIKDIIEGRMEASNVLLIVGGTRVTKDDLPTLCESYRVYWHYNPEYAAELLKDFYCNGKLVQPRLLDLQGPNIMRGHWAKIVRLETMLV